MLIPNNRKTFMSIDDKNGNLFENVCGYIEVVDVISKLEHLDEGDSIMLETNDNGNSSKFCIPEEDLQNSTSLRKHFARNRFTAENRHYHYIEDLITQQIRQIRLRNTSKFNHESLGWFTHNDERIFLMEKAISNSPINSTSIYEHHEFQKGCKEEYDTFLQDYIFKDPELTLALIISHTAILASLLKDKFDIGTIIVNISGMSSTGKTTIEHLMISPFMRPYIGESKVMPRINSTENALIQSLSNIHGVPIVIDDTTANKQLNFDNFIYTLSTGTSKSRCNSNGEKKNDGTSWSGLIVLSSETPILDFGQGIDGRCARTICLNNIPWTKDRETSKIIKETVKLNYGLTGPDYIKLILAQSVENLSNEFKSCQQEILDMLTIKDSFSNRISTNLAAVSLTSQYVQKHYDIQPVMVKDAMQILLDNEIKSTEERNVPKHAYDAFFEFATTNRTYFNNESHPHFGQMRIDCFGMRIYIYSKDIDTVFEKCKISKDNKQMIFSELKKRKLLHHDKDRSDTKICGVRAYCILYSYLIEDHDIFYNNPQYPHQNDLNLTNYGYRNSLEPDDSPSPNEDEYEEFSRRGQEEYNGVTTDSYTHRKILSAPNTRKEESNE